MTDPRLPGIIRAIRSDCSFFEARGMELFAAPLRVHIDPLEAICSGSATPAGFVGPSSGAERLLNVAELASRMGTSTDYIYRHAEHWPFTRRIGRSLRFSENGYTRWIGQQKR
jgi:predicted DNA-binding transcriptional regulator AlpA